MDREFIDINKHMDNYYGVVDIAKADAPVAFASDTGYFNPIHGRVAFSLFNNDAVFFNVLPKVGWTTSGFRVRTARGFTPGSGGVADAGAVPDTVKSTVVEVTTTLKQTVTAFEYGATSFERSGDDVYAFDEELINKGKDHLRDINAQLLKDANTLAGVNFESLDRIASNNSEASDGTIALGSNDADIYGLDRDSVTTYDAYVDHNSGTDRNITVAILRSMIETVTENSGVRPNVILTGYDQRQNILALFESQVRYMDTIKVGMNGVNTAEGYAMGAQIATVDGIPIFADSNVAKDTGSRVYCFNTEYLFLAIRTPTTITKSVSDLDMLNRGLLTRKVMFRTSGELICTNFATVGKIRDLN